MKKFTCPCCGYKTLDEQFSWEICLIGYWEDVPLQFEKVDLEAGANTVSLRQAQRNFIKFSVCEMSMIGCGRKPDTKSIKRFH